MNDYYYDNNDYYDSDSGDDISEECNICINTNNCRKIFMDGRCNHYCCNVCLKNYIFGRIRDKWATIQCPGRKKDDNYNQCEKILSYRRIKKYVSDQQLQELDKNIISEALPAIPIIYCPLCTESIKLEESHVKGKNKILKCNNCTIEFCIDCFEYNDENKYAYDNMENMHHCTLIEDLKKVGDFKRCPKCQTAVEKEEGCDCMKCPMCRRRFCWNCLKIFKKGDSVSKHREQERCFDFDDFNGDDSAGPSEEDY